MIISVFEAWSATGARYWRGFGTTSVSWKLPGSITTLPLALSGMRAVGEAPVDRGRQLGVLELAQVVEDLLALLGAEPLLQPAEELGAPGLVAAALAEELTLERVEREDVVARPRLVREAVGGEVVVDPLR